MKNLKKIISVMLTIIILSLVFVSCGENKKSFKAANDEIVKMYTDYHENNEVKNIKLSNKYGDYKKLIELEINYLSTRAKRHDNMKAKMNSLNTTELSSDSVEVAKKILDELNTIFDKEVSIIKKENDKLLKDIKNLNLSGELMKKYIDQTEKRIELNNKFYEEYIKLAKDLMDVFKKGTELSEDVLAGNIDEEKSAKLFQEMMTLTGKASELEKKYKDDIKDILKIKVD